MAVYPPHPIIRGVDRIRISVALCTYNGAPYIAEQLRSIARQTRPPDEVVICDDGSTDPTLEIIQSLERQLGLVLQVHSNERNLGPTRNFEKALKLCEGDWLFLADQDDSWDPKKIETIGSIFRSRRSVGAIFTDAEVTDGDLRPSGRSLFEAIPFTKRERRAFERGDYFKVLMRHNVATGATMAIRADLRNSIPPAPDAWLHDAWIVFAAAALSEVSFLEERLVLYRQHPEAQIGVPSSHPILRLQRHRDRHRKRLKQHLAAFTALVEMKPSFLSAELMSDIEQKRKHMATRTRLPSRVLSRLPPVVSELGHLRYHRYSRGFKAAIADLLHTV